ncbi:MFS transporter [Cytobacillus purgationiresistens]|uniref:DHA3 family tetracycline resistance protein-like MFS transporter n=1 Tax=Cytobacillus purgationiresistens TaxID=863449 RepID=A0ABU0ANU6_9BACI|nr:MFS transporter [Cytobacillus purgationiresistens]MDQ0272858.1 DHA3 family tetracycline resistance protein-like MFS transporter [Cytobacillus purgationiresistens]
MKNLQLKSPYHVYIYTCFLSQFFFTLVFTVNLLYHVQTVQLTALQLVLVGTVLELTVFLFEIPTGVVSDLKSRKLSMIIGYFLIGCGFFIEGLFPVFAAVIASQILWGIGYTFTSGSQQAWIADEIGETKASSAILKGARAGNFGQIIAIPISIILGYSLINLPIMIGGIAMVGLSLFVLIFMKEEHFIPQNKQKQITVMENMTDNLKLIITSAKMNRLIRLLLLIALFFGLYSEGFDRLWLSHLLEAPQLLGLTDETLVIMAGALNFIVMIFSFLALYIINRLSLHLELRKIYIALFIGAILIILSLLGFSLSTGIVSLIIFYMIIAGTRQVMYPLEDIWLNKIIPDSSARATFFSVKGQVDSIGQIGGGPFIGWIGSHFAIKIAIIASAVLLTPVLYLYRSLLKKKHRL